MALLGPVFRHPRTAGARSRSTRTRCLFWLLLFLFEFNLLGLSRAQDSSREYQLKAAFLFNFAQFVQWPSGSIAPGDEPFSIGILGDDPFGPAMEETIQGETIDHHKLTVRRSQNLADLEDCQIIFVCKSEENHVREILAELDSRPILTVGDMGNFAQDGGIIDFYRQGNKLRFEINPGSAQRRGLKISSQLLNLGKIVKPARGDN